MSESSAFVFDENGTQPPVSGPPAPPGSGIPFQGPYKFSPDELKVLNECNNESFFQRSLPLGTFMGLGAYYGIQQGHFKPNPRFGVVPKVTLAVVMGYFIGKLSYQEKCAEKLMALPGSYIGQLLRERKEGKLRGTSSKRTPTMFGAGPNDIYSDAGPGSSLDLDTDRPLFSDDFRPDSDGPPMSPPPDVQPPAPPTGPHLSYDDLRRRNRGEYSNSKQDPYRVDPSMAPPIPRRPPPPPTESSTKNKYGDDME